MPPAPLGIVIPVRDEAANIGETLRRIGESVSQRHTVYLVHDSPRDTTLPVAERYRRQGMDIVYLENPEGGTAHAIRRGSQVELVTADGSTGFGQGEAHLDRILEPLALYGAPAIPRGLRIPAEAGRAAHVRLDAPVLPPGAKG